MQYPQTNHNDEYRNEKKCKIVNKDFGLILGSKQGCIILHLRKKNIFGNANEEQAIFKSVVFRPDPVSC
jgi:hypothetical protein